MGRHQAGFLLILVLAVALRLLVLLQWSGDLLTDPDGYVAHARMVAQGYGFAGPSTQQPTAFRPPGLPLLLAAWMRFGYDPAPGVAMLHMATGVLTVLLTRQLAEQSGLSIGWSILAAGLAAADPLLLRYSALPMTEVLSACLLPAALLVFGKATGRPILAGSHPLPATASAHCDVPTPSGPSAVTGSLYVAVAAGIAFGLGALVRPVFLIVAGLLLLKAGLTACRQFHRSGGCPELQPLRPWAVRQLQIAVCCGIGLLLALSPWVIRNAQQFGKFIPATTHGGYTLALGNNPDYYRDVIQGRPRAPWNGQALDQWQQRMIRESAAAGIRPGDESATDAWMYAQAFQAIRRQPAVFLQACGLRVLRFWSPLPAADSAGYGLAARLTGIWYSCLWLGVVLAAVSWLQRSAEFRTADLWLSTAAFMLMHTFFWTDTRMRAPLMPVLCVLACCGGVTFLRCSRAVLTFIRQRT